MANIFTIGIIIFSVIFTITLSFLKIHTKLKIRTGKTFHNFRNYLGLTIEQGKRLHISLGTNSLTDNNSGASFVALTSLEQITKQSSLSDKPPISTSGSGDLAILAQDVVVTSMRDMNVIDRYEASGSYLSGPTTYSYISGLFPIVQQKDSSTHLLLGNYGAEIGLITEASRRKGAFSIAGTTSIQGQATILGCADEAAIGEDYFAFPHNLSKKPVYKISLHLQDILRWVTIIILVVGFLLKLVGLI